MTDPFYDLPNQIRNIYQLANSISEQQQRRGNDKKVDFLFKAKGSTFIAVDKKSLQGKWLQLKDRFSKKKTHDTTVASLIKNLQFLEKIDQSAFQAAVTSANISLDELNKKLEALRGILNLPPSHVKEATRKIVPMPPNSVQAQQATTAALNTFKYDAADRDTIKENLSKIFGEMLNNDEYNEVAGLLQFDVDRENIIAYLNDSTKSLPEKINMFRGCLIKAYGYARPSSIEQLDNVLQKIRDKEPSNIHEQPSDTLELKQFATVFGDSFISDSGLEGDAPVRYAALMREFINTLGVASPLARELQHILGQNVNLYQAHKPKQFIKEIQDALKGCPREPKRCILLGGWCDHTIIYEIVQHKEGTYTFRIYNEGEGADLTDSTQEGYKNKYSGCIEIQNVSHEYLFRENFVGALAGLTSQQRSNNCAPDTLLVDGILPLLDGTREPFDPSSGRMLSPQRSGTCSYSSLLAFLAHAMPENDYKMLKLDFEIHLLKKFLPQLHTIAKKEIDSEDMWQEVRQMRSVIEQSIAKLASETAKLAGNPSSFSGKIQEVLDHIATYRTELRLLQQREQEYEKTIYQASIHELTAQHIVSAPVNVPEEVQSTSDPLHIPFKSLDILKTIESIPKISVEECLQLLANANIPDRELSYIYLCFFKKLGSLREWTTVKFQRPDTAFAHLQKIIMQAAKGVQYNTSVYDPDRYIMVLAFHYGLEQAFKQLPENMRIPPLDFSSAISSLITPITNLQCLDPTLALFVEEIKQFDTRNQLGDFSQSSPKFGEATHTGVKKLLQTNTTLYESIAASITQDRTKQEAAIRDAQKRLNAQAKNATNEECTSLQSIDVRGNVENNVRYWPAWFNIADPGPREVAVLFGASKEWLLSKGIKTEVFSQQCRQLYVSVALCQNLFNKATVTDDTSGTFSWKLTSSWKCTDAEILSQARPNCFTEQLAYGNATPYSASLSNPSLKELCGNLSKVSRVQESDFAEHTHIEGVPFDTERELYAVHCAKNMQVYSIIDYFQCHIEQLEDPQWITLFHSGLFDSDLLIQELQNEEQCAILMPKLRNFFNNAIQHATETNRYDVVAQLVWLAAGVQKRIQCVSQPPLAKTFKELQMPIIDNSRVIPQLLRQVSKPQYASQWPVVFEAIVASGTSLITANKIDNKELFFCICLAHVMRNQLALEKKNVCLPRKHDAECVVLMIQAVLSQKPPLFTAEEIKDSPVFSLLPRLYPRLKDASCTCVGQNYICTLTDGTHLSLTSGTIIPSDPELLCVYDKPLPPPVCDLLHEQQLYPKEEQADLKCYIDDKNICHVHDPKSGSFFQIREHSIFVTIDQKIYKYIPKDSQTIHNYALKRRFNCYQSGKQLYFQDPRSGENVYASCEVNGVTRIKKIAGDGADLFIAQPPSPHTSPFASFEDPACTLYLADEKHIKRIEFPRLNMTLVQEIVNGQQRWTFAEDNEWFLSDEQFVPHFGQKTGFLVFQNEKGEKKVILPVWGPKEAKKRSLNFPYEYDFQAAIVPEGRYMQYDVRGDQLIPQSSEARFYLARIFLEKGYIDEAEKLLFHIQAEVTNKKLTESEKKILEGIAFYQSGNIGSRTLRLALHALYILEQNDRQFSKKSTRTEEQRKQATERMRMYLDRLGHMHPLEPQEEIIILDGLGCLDTTLCARYHELTGTDATPKSREWHRQGANNKQSSSFKNPPKANTWSKMQYAICRSNGKFPFDPHDVTTPQFNRYYKLIHSECAKVSNYERALKSGLLPMLYQLSFSPYPEVSNSAKGCIALVETKPGSRMDARGQQHEPSTKPLTPRTIPSGYQELVSLENFQTTSTEQEIFQSLSSLCEEQQSVDSHKKAASNTFTNPVSGDIAVQQKFESQNKDLGAATSKTTTACQVRIKDGLISALENSLKEQAKILADQELHILAAVGSGLMADPVVRLDFESKKRQLPSIEELCILCARAHFTDYIEKQFPEISAEGRKRLHAAIKEYLQQKALVQHLHRSLQDALNLEGADEATKAQLAQVLANSIKTQRAYEPKTDPYAMIFLTIETCMNIMLRSDQVAKIREFADKMNKGEQVVLQMIMGGGKTSVLQPLLAFLFADPKSLSTVTLPKSLIKPVSDQLAKTLGFSFAQSVFVLPYSRKKARDVQYLKDFYAKLQNVQQRGGCALFTPRQKHSILTSLYEAYDALRANPDDTSVQERIEIICKIQRFLQTSEKGQIDEFELSMDPDVVFKYPIGERTALDADCAEIVADMMIQLAMDKEIQSQVSIDFINAFQNRIDPTSAVTGAPFTQAVFSSVIEPKLVKIAMSLLKKRKGLCIALDNDANGYIKHFLAKSTPYDQKIQNSYLPKEASDLINRLSALPSDALKQQKTTADEKLTLIIEKILYTRSMDEWIQKNIPADPDRELLAACAHAISNVLPEYSLSRECLAHYGHDLKGNKQIACIYDAPESQKPTMPSDPYQQLALTVQMYLYDGVPRTTVEKMLSKIRKDVQKDLRNKVALPDSASYQLFQQIFGKELSGTFPLLGPITEDYIAEFQKALSKHPQGLLQCMKQYVFPEIGWYARSVSSTPQTIIGSSKYVCGYTGTPQDGVLSRTMTLIREEGTDGSIINAIGRKYADGTSQVHVIQKGEGTLTERVRQQFLDDPQLFVFIDSGGWLKDTKISEYARDLLEKCQEKRRDIEGIVYHNEKGDIVCVERDSTGKVRCIPIDPLKHRTESGKYLTIIAQKYETGTNILQAPSAKAVVSVRKDMTLRATLQSVFRMRKILEGQSVSFLVSEDVRLHIASTFIDEFLTIPQCAALFTQKPVPDAESVRPVLKNMGMPEHLVSVFLSAFEKTRTIANQVHQNKKTTNEYMGAFIQAYALQLQNITPDDIWRYTLLNQTHMEQRKNWISGQQRMREVIEKPIRMALVNEELSLQERHEIFLALQEFHVQSASANMYDTMAKTASVVSKEQAKRREVDKLLKTFEKIHTLSTNVQEVICKNVEQLYGTNNPNDSKEANALLTTALESCINLDTVSSVIKYGGGSDEEEVEEETQVEQEQEQEQEKEKEKELELESIESEMVENVPYRFLFSAEKVENGYSTKSFFTTSPTVPFEDLSVKIPPDTARVSKERIEYSPNLFVNNDCFNSSPHALKYLPTRYFVALYDETTCSTRWIAVSHQDASYIKMGIRDRDSAQHAVLFSVNGQVVAKSDEKADTHFDKDVLQKVCVQLKLCDASSAFSPQEITCIRNTIESVDEQAREEYAGGLKKFYEGIVQYLPGARNAYHNTALQRLFNEYSSTTTSQTQSLAAQLRAAHKAGNLQAILNEYFSVKNIENIQAQLARIEWSGLSPEILAGINAHILEILKNMMVLKSFERPDSDSVKAREVMILNILTAKRVPSGLKFRKQFLDWLMNTERRHRWNTFHPIIKQELERSGNGVYYECLIQDSRQYDGHDSGSAQKIQQGKAVLQTMQRTTLPPQVNEKVTNALAQGAGVYGDEFLLAFNAVQSEVIKHLNATMFSDLNT